MVAFIATIAAKVNPARSWTMSVILYPNEFQDIRLPVSLCDVSLLLTAGNQKF
jgi:hypothetical protein